MTGEGWAAIIIALAGLITSSTAAFVSIAGLRKSSQNSNKIDQNSTKIDEVHKLTNSLSERAQAQAREAGNAEGQLKARADVAAQAGSDALARERSSPPIPTPPKDAVT